MKISKTEHFMSKKAGRAIAEYDLINEGDKILVAVSGGKDSLTLLDILQSRQKWVPIKYELLACHVVTNYKQSGYMDEEALKRHFEKKKVRYIIKKIDVYKESKKEKISCFWCSWNRRKALFELAMEEGCNKIALGHHMDDVIETTLMNLFYNGEFSSVNPKQALFDGKVTIIRPLVYLLEKDTRAYAKKMSFPVSSCLCPNDDISKRKLMKDVINTVEKTSDDVRMNIFRAPRRVRWDYLGKRSKADEKSAYKSMA